VNSRFSPSRRRFLKVGVLGSVVLAAAGGGIALSRKPGPRAGSLWLQADDWSVLQAIVPVMLAGALPDDPPHRISAINQVVSGVDLTVAHFPPAVRAEIRQLLWLLESSFLRPIVTGLWSDWSSVGDENIRSFLQRWNRSRLDLLRVGYTALHDLIVGAWYANPLSWQRIHYPGPPVLS
jgi:hypothetical protein